MVGGGNTDLSIVNMTVTTYSDLGFMIYGPFYYGEEDYIMSQGIMSIDGITSINCPVILYKGYAHIDPIDNKMVAGRTIHISGDIVRDGDDDFDGWIVTGDCSIDVDGNPK